MKNLKVVLAHDWLLGYRGGERVFTAMCEMFPDAPIYTLLHRPGTTSEKIDSHKIKSSFLNSIPGIENRYRHFLPLFPSAVNRMKVQEKADLILSSSHCVIKGLKGPSGCKHISYLHSPMRYIYDQFPTYFGKNKSLPIRAAAHLVRPYLTMWDKLSNEHIDEFVANSDFVKKRIEHFYHRKAQVIYPFVELDDFQHLENEDVQKSDNYLMVTAFAPNKRVDLAIEAFNQLGKPLRIIGSGQEQESLKKMASHHITFLGNVDRKTIVSEMAKAKGFIFPGIEDFGITPLESMAAGTPIIAYKAGGVLETLNEKTSVFFSQETTQSLIEAVKSFERKEFLKTELIAQAKKFSKPRFTSELSQLISSNFK
jgi:glycosyltransferase involved in cell wall biosynthesis